MSTDGNNFILEIGDEQMVLSYDESTDIAVITERDAFGTTATTHASGAAVTRLIPMDIVAVMDIDDKREVYKLACKESAV